MKNVQWNPIIKIQYKLFCQSNQCLWSTWLRCAQISQPELLFLSKIAYYLFSHIHNSARLHPSYTQTHIHIHTIIFYFVLLYIATVFITLEAKKSLTTETSHHQLLSFIYLFILVWLIFPARSEWQLKPLVGVKQYFSVEILIVTNVIGVFKIRTQKYGLGDH